MSTFALKVKCKAGQQVLRDLTADSTVGELKVFLHSISEIDIENLSVRLGFPPKTVDISDNSKTLKDIGLASGETLIVEETKQTVKNTSSGTPDQSILSNGDEHTNKAGILMKQVVPSDNSCLFTSIGFVLNGKVDTSIGSIMRQIIASEVASDPETYNEGVLGRPNREYCEWILLPNSWGGAIEVSILSRYYGIEMDVVDTLNAIINRFGEDKDYGQRVFLLFDGIHYDPLYLELANGGGQSIFPTENLDVYREAEQLALEAKAARQFTDVNKFTLKCMVCGVHLTGQAEAQKHAQETNHMNFGEV